MAMLVTDPELEEEIRQERRAGGEELHYEVWDGVTMMTPIANDEHQELATLLGSVFVDAITKPKLGAVRVGVNVSDRTKGWRQNFRIPDVAVFLNGTQAIKHPAFWEGGPDFAVEIVSPHDMSRDKLRFYAQVGTQELLFVDRDPWQLELYRLDGDVLKLAGRVTPADQNALASTVLPLTFRLLPGDERPQLDVRHADGIQSWFI